MEKVVFGQNMLNCTKRTKNKCRIDQWRLLSISCDTGNHGLLLPVHLIVNVIVSQTASDHFQDRLTFRHYQNT